MLSGCPKGGDRYWDLAQALLLDPVPTGILQSEATRWPMQTLPEKLRQQLLISQEEGYTCISSNSNSDLIVRSEPFCEFIAYYMNDISLQRLKIHYEFSLDKINYEFLRDLNIMSVDEIDVKLNIMSDSSVRIAQHLGQVTHSPHIALINLCFDNHFCMWMLLQLSEIMP